MIEDIRVCQKCGEMRRPGKAPYTCIGFPEHHYVSVAKLLKVVEAAGEWYDNAFLQRKGSVRQECPACAHLPSEHFLAAALKELDLEKA